MAGETILATLSEELARKVTAGTAERIGMVVRDTATKKIIGHLQETGITQSLMNRALEMSGTMIGSTASPIGALTGAIGVVQNEQIKSKIDLLQSAMGGLQSLQIATLATGVVGMGVTIASTAIILGRLKSLERSIQGVYERIDGISSRVRDWDIEKSLRSIEVQLERLAEAEVARKSDQMLETTEHELHKGFGELQRATVHIVRGSDVVDPRLLESCIGVLALSGAAQMRCLTKASEFARAEMRAQRQIQSWREISVEIPRDRLVAIYGGAVESAERIDAIATEIRMRVASQPSLFVSMRARDMNGAEYLRRLENEDEDPLLLLPQAA